MNSIAGDKQLNRERVKNASQLITAEVFFIPKIKLERVIYIHIATPEFPEMAKKETYVKGKSDCARVVQASRTVA